MKVWINYHHLLYFRMIAEEGSVSKAAEILNLGQPTLSAQLKQFEETLGVQLFERQHKRLILTEQGRVALEYAKNIFHLGNEMYEALQDNIVPTRVNVQLGAIDDIPKYVMLELTKAAYKIGKCHVSLIEGSPDVILRELLAYRIDLFISNYVPTALETKGLIHRPIVKKHVSIYGAPQFKSLKKNFPESLRGQPIIMPTYDSKLRYDVEHWSKVRVIAFDIIAESQDVSLKKLMAVEGLGLIPAAAHTVARQVEAGELIEIGRLDGVSEELFLISAQRKRENPITSKLMKNFTL